MKIQLFFLLWVTYYAVFPTSAPALIEIVIVNFTFRESFSKADFIL